MRISTFGRILFVGAMLFCPVVHAAQTDTKPWQAEGEIAKNTDDLCEKADHLPLPVQDMPNDADKAALKGCASRDLYYGIGEAKDDVAARKCAYIELSQGDSLVMGGSSILMMIYANGYGVPKNLDLSLKLACNIGGAPREVEGRVDHVTELKTIQPGKPLKECLTEPKLGKDYCNGILDICDDITSGFMEGNCARTQSDIQEAKNKAAFDTVTVKWPAADQQAFNILAKASAAYINAHSGNEIDLSGTDRGAESIDESDKMTANFRAAVTNFEKGKFPQPTTGGFAKADRDLNASYGIIMKNNFSDAGSSGISKDSIKKTQRLWIDYRDAWISFAAVHYPQLQSDNLKSWLTRQRIKILEQIPVSDE